MQIRLIYLLRLRNNGLSLLGCSRASISTHCFQITHVVRKVTNSYFPLSGPGQAFTYLREGPTRQRKVQHKSQDLSVFLFGDSDYVSG